MLPDDRGTVHRFPQPDIVIQSLGPCERCGQVLWSRNGSGKYTIAIENFNGSPLLEHHLWLINCRDSPEESEVPRTRLLEPLEG